MQMIILVESKPFIDARFKVAYGSTVMNLNGEAIRYSVAMTAVERIALKSIIA